MTKNAYFHNNSSSKSKVRSRHLFFICLVIVILLLFHLRHKIAEAYDRYRMRRRLRYNRLGGFEEDIENGLSSNTFDIRANIDNSDQRNGLSEEAKNEIKRIMTTQNISFDEARLQYTQQQLNRNGVSKDGLPVDPRLVTFN